MLRAVAIDDEPIALEVIKSLSSKVSFIDLTAVFTDAFKAIEYIHKEKTDLLFLDIKMPDILGTDLMKSIPNPPMVIFTTAYSEHAVQSFELDAIDYLLKPFSQQRFLKACNKAYEQFLLRKKKIGSSNDPEYVFIKSGNEQIRTNLEDILYIESLGNYIQFILNDQKIVSRLTITDAEDLLPASDFIRIHRSYIVAKKHIQKMTRNSIWINNKELPIGASYFVNIQKIGK